MRLSWSHKLFFKINNLIGKSKFLDTLSYFCAHWLIYIVGASILSWGVFILAAEDPEAFIFMIKLLLTSLVTAEIISYGIALVWRHSRPIVEFPNIKTLLHSVEKWKSFPSDHTIIVFTIAFVTYMVGASFFLYALFLLLALAVSIGRIFVGVHYPRDVVGGIILSGIVVYLSPWILEIVTQPVYDVIKLFF